MISSEASRTERLPLLFERTTFGKNFRFFSFFVTSKKFSKIWSPSSTSVPRNSLRCKREDFTAFLFPYFGNIPQHFCKLRGSFLLGLLQLVQEKHKIWMLQMHKCKKKNSSERQMLLKVWSTLFLCKEQLGRSWDFFNKFCLMRKKMLVSFPLFHIWFTFLNGFLFSPLIYQVETTPLAPIHQCDHKTLSRWPHGRDLGQMLTYFSNLRTISIPMLHHRVLKGRHVGFLLFGGHWSGDRVRVSQGGLSPAQRVHLHGLEPKKTATTAELHWCDKFWSVLFYFLIWPWWHYLQGPLP